MSKVTSKNRNNRIEVEEANDLEKRIQMQTFCEEMVMFELELNENSRKNTRFQNDDKEIRDYVNQTSSNKIGVLIDKNGKADSAVSHVKKSKKKKSYKKLDLTGIQSKYLNYNKQTDHVFKDYLHKSNKPFIGYVSKV
jgi:hypothetical protein